MLPERHVDLGAQHARAVGKFAGAHAAEQVEVLLHRAIAIRAVLPGLGQRAAGETRLFLGLVVHIGLAGADQLLGPAVEALEIVRRMIEVLAPVEAEPAHVRFDRVDVFLLFLGRVGVVEAQIAVAAELLRDPEVEADGFGVPDMQIAVRLGRKARHHALVAPRRKIVRHDVADEIAPGFRFDLFCNRHHEILVAPATTRRI